LARLALAGVIAFYGANGRRLTLTHNKAYDLVIDVATGALDSVDGIAARLRTATQPHPVDQPRYAGGG
jgi:death on curing protein